MKRGSADRIERRLASLAHEASAPSEPTIAQLRVLIAALASAEAPTAVRDSLRAVDVHVADSLSGLRIAELDRASTVADLGSGAGLPALALAAARPTMCMQAVESNGRKAGFIAATAERMGLTNVEVVARRAEEWPDGVGACDAVCARALAALPVLVEYAAPLLRLDGVLVAWKGVVEPAELAAGCDAASIVGLRLETVLPVNPFPGATNHTLLVYRKIAPTPERFPRRAGMAVKRPLFANNLHQDSA